MNTQHDSTSSSPSAAKRIIPTARLHINPRNADPVSLELDGAVITIGRDSANKVVLEDDSVSSHHAELFPRRGEWVLRDLRSSNGTTLNGHPVVEATVKDGDVIGIAGVECRFEDTVAPNGGQAEEPQQRQKGLTPAPTTAQMLWRAPLPKPLSGADRAVALITSFILRGHEERPSPNREAPIVARAHERQSGDIMLPGTPTGSQQMDATDTPDVESIDAISQRVRSKETLTKERKLPPEGAYYAMCRRTISLGYINDSTVRIHIIDEYWEKGGTDYESLHTPITILPGWDTLRDSDNDPRDINIEIASDKLNSFEPLRQKYSDWSKLSYAEKLIGGIEKPLGRFADKKLIFVTPDRLRVSGVILSQEDVAVLTSMIASAPEIKRRSEAEIRDQITAKRSEIRNEKLRAERERAEKIRAEQTLK